MLAASTAVLLCQLAIAQPATRPASGSIAAAGREPEYGRTVRVPDDVLGGSDRKAIILPSEPGESADEPSNRSGGIIGRATPEIPRLPDGYVIAGREATVQRDGNWYVIQPARMERLPEAPPLRVLPNRRLTMLETIFSTTAKPSRLIVTGRVTEFMGRNYILLEDFTETVVAAPDRKHLESAIAGEPPPENKQASQPADREPTAEEVVRRLMESKPVKSVVLPELAPTVTTWPTDERSGNTATDFSEAVRWPEETLLVDRQGRVIPGEPWWQLVFEDRGGNPAEKPLRLLPNRLLETALSISDAGARGVVFIISGEVTEYKGANYLLLRKVLVRRDLGNFR